MRSLNRGVLAVSAPGGSPSPASAPVANFTYSVSGLTVTITNQSVPGASGTITGYSYDWGDGSTPSTTPSPSHTYAAAGTYTVTQNITGGGSDGTSQKSVAIPVATPTPAVYGGIPGIGVLEYGGNLVNIASGNRSLYNILIGSSYGADVNSVIVPAPGLGISYMTPTVVSTGFNTGVTYTDASNNGWLLKNSAGAFMTAGGFPNNYAADIGSVAYQNKFISNVLAYLNAHPGLDGLFLDTILYSPVYDFGGYPTKYPSQSSWETAMLSCCAAIHNALSAQGYYMLCNAVAYISGDPNSGNGVNDLAWWTALNGHCDGMMNEYYAETSSGTNARKSGIGWTGFQKLIGQAQSQNQDWYGLMYGNAGDTTQMQYGKASFLMEWNGNSVGRGGAGGGAFIYKSGSTDPTNSSWTKNMGAPSGPKIAVGVGFMRPYANGTALVNPDPSSSQTFTVNGVNHTLAAVTGLIL